MPDGTCRAIEEGWARIALGTHTVFLHETSDQVPRAAAKAAGG